MNPSTWTFRFAIGVLGLAWVAGCAAQPKKPALPASEPQPWPPPATQPSFEAIKAKAANIRPAFPRPMYARRQTIVRQGKGALYRPIAALARGEEVEAIAREDNWIRIDSDAARGWVHRRSLSNAPLDMDHEANDLFPPGAPRIVESFTDAEDLLDIGGEGWDAADFATDRRLRIEPLTVIVNDRRRLTPQQLKRFMTEGGLAR